jgi:tetratricopeptide (TPR) repeat protein
LVWRPYFASDTTFTVLERAVLLGLLAGYLTHNLVVFDNIVSYIFFGVMLALIHVRVSRPIASIQSFSVPNPITAQVIAPIVAIVVGVMVYVGNVPGIIASGQLIDGFRVVNTNPREALVHFENALDQESFAQQEVVEQLAQQAMNIVRNPAVPNDVKAAYAALAEEQLNRMVKEKPGDARLHVFFSGFYRSSNQLDKAKEQIDIARELSPNKQAIILQQGAIALALNDMEGARDYFKYAYELDTRNEEALEFYLASLFYLKDTETANQLLVGASETFKDRLARNDFFVGAVHDAGDFNFLADLYERRVAESAVSPQEWASLAFVYYQLKQNDKAIETLSRASAAIPSFAPIAACFTNNITAGREPQLGCVATSSPAVSS